MSTEGRPLRCPYCGDVLEIELTYASGYTEHRDFTGIECTNYSCDARWDPRGGVERLPRGEAS